MIPPGGRRSQRLGLEERLRIFDAGMERQKRYEATLVLPDELPAERDWKREDLYTRGEPD